jgi:hypothetical protein
MQKRNIKATVKEDFRLEYDHTGYVIRGSNLQTIRAMLDEMTGTKTRTAPLAAIPHRSAAVPRRRVLSADARKRIADAQKKRWAATKAQQKKKAPAAKAITAAG